MLRLIAVLALASLPAVAEDYDESVAKIVDYCESGKPYRPASSCAEAAIAALSVRVEFLELLSPATENQSAAVINLTKDCFLLVANTTLAEISDARSGVKGCVLGYYQAIMARGQE